MSSSVDPTGLEHRYYLHSHALGLSVSGGYPGLVQPLRAELEFVQYHGGGLLPICARGGFARGPVRDLQLRPRLAIHLQPVSAAAQGPVHPHQYGWAWASPRQCVYRAAVALGEIRTDLSRRLRFRRRTLVGVALLLRPLQFPPPASGVELPHPGRSLSKPSTEKRNKVSRCAAVFAFTAHGLARELHQNNAPKRKALQYSQRAYHQPIPSEPVRRFGRGHAPGATPMRSPSLAESAAVCDPGFQPRRSSLERPKFCPTIGVHLSPLAYKWIRILFRCWKDRTSYCESTYLQGLERRQPLARKGALVRTRWKASAGFRKIDAATS